MLWLRHITWLHIHVKFEKDLLYTSVVISKIISTQEIELIAGHIRQILKNKPDKVLMS